MTIKRLLKSQHKSKLILGRHRHGGSLLAYPLLNKAPTFQSENIAGPLGHSHKAHSLNHVSQELSENLVGGFIGKHKKIRPLKLRI